MIISLCRSFRSALLSASVVSPKEIQTKENEEYSKGWERLKAIYSKDEYGIPSKQSTMIMESGLLSFLIGFAIGGVPASKNALAKFVEENEAAIYYNHMDVKKRLQRAVVESFCRSGFHVAWRLSVFTTAVLTTILSINAFMGKSSVLEFIVGGTALGAAHKFIRDKKPLIKSAVIGGCVGGAVGSIIVNIMSNSGVTFTDIFTNISIDEDIDRTRQEK